MGNNETLKKFEKVVSGAVVTAVLAACEPTPVVSPSPEINVTVYNPTATAISPTETVSPTLTVELPKLENITLDKGKTVSAGGEQGGAELLAPELLTQITTTLQTEKPGSTLFVDIANPYKGFTTSDGRVASPATLPETYQGYTLTQLGVGFGVYEKDGQQIVLPTSLNSEGVYFATAVFLVADAEGNLTHVALDGENGVRLDGKVIDPLELTTPIKPEDPSRISFSKNGELTVKDGDKIYVLDYETNKWSLEADGVRTTVTAPVTSTATTTETVAATPIAVSTGEAVTATGVSTVEPTAVVTPSEVISKETYTQAEIEAVLATADENGNIANMPEAMVNFIMSKENIDAIPDLSREKLPEIPRQELIDKYGLDPTLAKNMWGVTEVTDAAFKGVLLGVYPDLALDMGLDRIGFGSAGAYRTKNAGKDYPDGTFMGVLGQVEAFYEKNKTRYIIISGKTEKTGKFYYIGALANVPELRMYDIGSKGGSTITQYNTNYDDPKNKDTISSLIKPGIVAYFSTPRGWTINVPPVAVMGFVFKKYSDKFPPLYPDVETRQASVIVW